MFAADPMLDAILRGTILAALGLVWVVALVRVVGLRSFSKMTSFDFVMTVAMGSLLGGAAQATGWTALVQVLAAMTALFAVQWFAAVLRKSSALMERVIQNEPVILMRDGRFIDHALARTRVAKTDVLAKLREANVLAIGDVRAVVLETTGNISVLHGERLEEAVLEGVRSR